MPSVRPILAEDWPAYRKLRLSALEEAPQAFGSTWEQERVLPHEEWAARALASAAGLSARGFLALQDNAPCGLAWCLLAQRDPRIAHVHALWTAPAARGQGAGRALLQQCIAWARSRGAHKVCLSVTTGESPALQLYGSQGFYPVGEPVLLRQDAALTAQKMQLDLVLEGD